MLNIPEKTTEEIKSEFKNQFTSTISPKVKQFNKKRFILAIEGIVSLIIPAAMAYIFLFWNILQHLKIQTLQF